MTDDKISSLVGLWWLPQTPNDHMTGTLSVDDEGWLTLKMVGTFEEQPTETLRSMRAPVRHDWPVVCGIVPGRLCVLERLQWMAGSRSVPGFDETTYSVEAAYLGLHDSPETVPVFRSVMAEIDTLGPWTGLAPIRVLEAGENGTGETGFTYTQPPEILLGRIGQFTARLTSRCEPSSNDLSASLHIRVQLILDAEEAFKSQDCLETIGDFCSFLSLMTGYPSSLNRLSGIPSVATPSLSNEKHVPQIPVRVLLSSLRQDPTWNNLSPRQMLITMNDLPAETVISCIQKWFDVNGALKPVHDLLHDFTSNLHTYSRGRFLTSIQALEVLDRKTRQATFMPPNVFDTWKQRIEEAAPEPVAGWFAKVVDHANEPSLCQRLLHLSEQCSSILDIANNAEERRKQLARKAAATRNYFTHYSREPRPSSVAQGTELIELTDWIENVVRMTLFRQLGVSDDTQRTLFRLGERPWWRQARDLFVAPASS